MKTSAHGISGRKFVWLAAAAVLVTALAACGSVRLPGQHKTLQNDGGLRITLSLTCPVSGVACDIQRLSAQTRDILEQRAIEGLGVADAVARLDGNTTIVVELPAYHDSMRAGAVLGSRGELDFIDTGGTPLQVTTNVSTQLCAAACTPGQYKILFTGAQLDPNSVTAGLDQQSQQPIVTFAFSRDAQQQFAEYTRQHIGQYLTIALDGTVIESATIQSEIAGTGQITGLKDIDTAQTLVTQLKYHALPLAVTVGESMDAMPSSTHP